MVMCTGVLTTVRTLIVASTSMGIAGASDQDDVILPSALIPMGTVRGVAGFTTVAVYECANLHDTVLIHRFNLQANSLESVHQNCVMGRCANLHIHILLQQQYHNKNLSSRCILRFMPIIL